MVNSKLDDVFSALSDPTRRDILQRLLGGELSVSELATTYNMSLPAVSKHLKVLEAAKLVTKERRGRQYFAKISLARFRNAADYLLYYETVLNKRLDSLDTYLKQGAHGIQRKAQNPQKPTTQQTLTITHTFDASAQRMWDVYTDPKHVSGWWGSQNTTVIGCYNDVRVGGIWRFVFKGADGQDYVVSGKYKEVTMPKRLVYTDGFGEVDSSRPEAFVTVEFETLPNGRTKLTKTSVAPRTTHQLQAAWLKAAENLLDESS